MTPPTTDDASLVRGEYEAEANVLRLSHPQPLVLEGPAIIEQLFKEVTALIEACPRQPYLLVDYANLEIRPAMIDDYARCVRLYRPAVLDVFRFNLSPTTAGTLTKVAVRVANKAAANIFADESEAREAIRRARQRLTLS